MSEPVIEENQVVSFTYRILDQEGVTLEQSDVPLEYIHGVSDTMFPAVESALHNKRIGDTVEVSLPPQQGFGDYNPELVFTEHIESVSREFRWVGATPTFENERGEKMKFTVREIEGDRLTVDANHPFAGKTVTFRVKVMQVRSASDAELRNTRAQVHVGLR